MERADEQLLTEEPLLESEAARPEPESDDTGIRVEFAAGSSAPRPPNDSVRLGNLKLPVAFVALGGSILLHGGVALAVCIACWAVVVTVHQSDTERSNSDVAFAGAANGV